MAEAVAFDQVIRLIGPGGQLGQFLQRHALTVVEQTRHGFHHGVDVVLLDHVGQPSRSDFRRRHTGMHIADGALRQAHVGFDHRHERLVDAARVVQFHEGKLQALLVDLRRFRRHGTRLSAAHLGPMRLVDRPRYPPCAMKHGHENDHIREMRAAAFVGNIRYQNISRRQIFGRRVTLQRRLHRRIEGGAVALRDQVAACIRYAHRKIGGLVDDRTHAGADHGVEHFVADGHERILDDFERKRIMVHG